METSKIVGVQDEALIPSSLREEESVSVDRGNEAAQRISPKSRDQHSSAPNTDAPKGGRAPRDIRKGLSKLLRIPRPRTKVETEANRIKYLSAKRRSKTLRSSAGPRLPEQGGVENLNSTRRSANPRVHKFQEGGRSPEKPPGQRMWRSSSTEEAVARKTSLERTSLCRSSSEQEYSTQLLTATRVSPRNSSRRWRDDAFPCNEQGAEGELDSIFRFIEECTRAVVNVLKEIPTFISELPKRTKEAVERFFLLLQGPNVPLLEGPNNSS